MVEGHSYSDESRGLSLPLCLPIPGGDTGSLPPQRYSEWGNFSINLSPNPTSSVGENGASLSRRNTV